MKSKNGYGSLPASAPSDEDVESGRRRPATSVSGTSDASSGGARVIHPPVSRERGNSISGTPKVGRSPHGGSAIATGHGAMRMSDASDKTGSGRASHQRAFSAQDTTPLLRGLGRSASQGGEKSLTGSYLVPIAQNGRDFCDDDTGSRPSPRKRSATTAGAAADEKKRGGFLSYIIYAVVNIIISVPGLYGYSSVIFNHPVFADYMNALPKLVIFSSCIHQLGFTLFSTLPFAIGTVQDAGLIFLSAMSNVLAEEILSNGGTAEEVLSTTLVLLPMGTACLGGILMLMGRFRLADAVAYLPMPVVGGYLAFIGETSVVNKRALLRSFGSIIQRYSTLLLTQIPLRKHERSSVSFMDKLNESSDLQTRTILVLYILGASLKIWISTSCPNDQFSLFLIENHL